MVWRVAAVLALAAVAFCMLVYRLHSRTRSRERFEGGAPAPPSASSAAVSLFDLREVAQLPTALRESLRAAFSTLSGALVTKLDAMYATNPGYVDAAIRDLADAGLNAIKAYAVPPPPPPSPPAPEKTT